MSVETFKKLGESSPAATTNTTLYTVPTQTQAIVHNLVICNANGTDQTVRVYVVKAGGSAAISNAIYYGATVYANATITAGPFMLAASDSIVVYASATNVAFNAFGAEFS